MKFAGFQVLLDGRGEVRVDRGEVRVDREKVKSSGVGFSRYVCSEIRFKKEIRKLSFQPT